MANASHTCPSAFWARLDDPRPRTPCAVRQCKLGEPPRPPSPNSPDRARPGDPGAPPASPWNPDIARHTVHSRVSRLPHAPEIIYVLQPTPRLLAPPRARARPIARALYLLSRALPLTMHPSSQSAPSASPNTHRRNPATAVKNLSFDIYILKKTIPSYLLELFPHFRSEKYVWNPGINEKSAFFFCEMKPITILIRSCNCVDAGPMIIKRCLFSCDVS